MPGIREPQAVSVSPSSQNCDRWSSPAFSTSSFRAYLMTIASLRASGLESLFQNTPIAEAH
jgi:hypothetical protein